MIANYNDIFQTAGCLSPAFDIGYEKIKTDLQKISTDSKILLYRGTEEWWYFIERDFAEELTKKGMKYGENILYYEAKNGTHSNQSWGEIIENVFIMFKGKKSENVIDIKIFDELNYSWEQNKFTLLVNPIVEMDNGIKYSLINSANYKILNTSDGEIKKNGEFIFKSSNNLLIEVEYNGFKKNIEIDYEKTQSKIKRQIKTLKKELKKQLSYEEFVTEIEKDKYKIIIDDVLKKYKITKEFYINDLKKMEKNKLFQIIDLNDKNAIIDLNN